MEDEWIPLYRPSLAAAYELKSNLQSGAVEDRNCVSVDASKVSVFPSPSLSEHSLPLILFRVSVSEVRQSSGALMYTAPPKPFDAVH